MYRMITFNWSEVFLLLQILILFYGIQLFQLEQSLLIVVLGKISMI